MQRFIVFSVLCLLFLAGCAKEVKQNNRPDWIDKPDGYFVGKCATHVKACPPYENYL